MTDPSTRKRRKRWPNVGALIADAERAGKHVTSITVTFRFDEPTHDERDQGDIDLNDWMAKRHARKAEED